MKHMELGLDDPARLCAVTRALGSEVRIQILRLLNEGSMNVVELSQRMGVPVSTVSNNIVILEEAELIRTERQNGIRGVMKLCSRKVDTIGLQLMLSESREVRSYFQHMAIGHFTDCQIEPVCGLLSVNEAIGQQDDPSAFYDPGRFDAQLLWFHKGYVEYRFSSQPLQNNTLRCLELSFEACAEAPNYRIDWPSDITLWINGMEIGTWLCPGDYGGRQGRNSPDWWSLSSTQYGVLKRWRVDDTGTTLDDMPVSSVTLDDLRLSEQPFIRLRIGIKEDARHQGGINLFGEQFGDHSQPIIMRLDCVAKHPAERSE